MSLPSLQVPLLVALGVLVIGALALQEYMARKLDRDRWLRGMRRLRDKTGEGQNRGEGRRA